MAGRIREEDIAAVRARSPIDAVIGEYIQLRGAGGGSLKGLCPFHEEKTPSFNVTPARGLFYCFGCAESGDVIRFVQKIEGLDFVAAVERLAARAGVELRYERGGYVPGHEQSQRRRLVEAHRAAAEFYAERLAGDDAAAARAFLAERGFERSDTERFGVGYAPAAWDALTRHLRGRGFTDAELLTGGLAREGRRGLVDRFRDRLMWPIRDLTGDVIGFGGRTLAGDGPKYLNTPETPLFRKGSVLYGADLARREIIRHRQAVVVEGYTDVMACHLAGVSTAVATCGTAFGREHVGILRRLVMDTDGTPGEIIFTFDGDEAGRKAALRAFDLEERFVTQTFVAVQPDGLDPCELRVARGDAAVRDLVARRVPLFEFAIRAVLDKYDLDTTEGQLAALDEAAPIVAGIKDAGLRARYAVNLDRWLGLMDERFVLARVRRHARDRRAAVRGGAPATAGVPASRRPTPATADDAYSEPRDPVAQVEREALKLAVQRPAICGPEFDALGAEAFTVLAHAEVFRVIARCGGTATAAGGAAADDGDPAADWVARLRTQAPDDRIRTLITRLAVEQPRFAGEPDARYADEVVARVHELAVSREIAAVKAKLQRMSPVDQQTDYNRLFGHLVTLEQRRKALLQRVSGE